MAKKRKSKSKARKLKSKSRKPAVKAKPKRRKSVKKAEWKLPPAKPAAKAKTEPKPEANPWHPVTDPAPEGQVLEINGEYDRKPELAVKTNGVWRAHVEGEKTKPVSTMAPVEVAAPRRWRLRTPK